jgi:hypothetical protein
MKKIIQFFLLILILLFMNCQKETKSSILQCNDEIKADTITEIIMNRGGICMKNLENKYCTDSWCSLVYKDTFPNWIEDHNKPDYSFTKYTFTPQISDIDVPYVIIKKRNECFFTIIKNGDTLKFEFKN